MSSKLTQNEDLKKAVSILNAEFHPLRLILFGSRVDDTADEESDYDFVMIMCECTPELQLEYRRRARQLLAKQFIDADVFVYSERDFEIRRHDFSTIPEVASTTGYELDLNE